MSDRLQRTNVIRRDDVSPRSIEKSLSDIVVDLDIDASDRLLALDWNTFRIEAASVEEAGSLFGPQRGDLRIQASVSVL